MIDIDGVLSSSIFSSRPGNSSSSLSANHWSILVSEVTAFIVISCVVSWRIQHLSQREKHVTRKMLRHALIISYNVFCIALRQICSALRPP
ncbi:MAG TPA: hypothetical protein ENJ80_00630 [Gammaproteobacteria bacterium]|nr:hypothetical protein [Gammaproteobacteria bacterium]